MAEVKWIKLTTDMFDNRKIKHLRRLPEGNNIVLIWVMLLTMAGRCNASGMIFLTENIPYTPKMLADELDFEESTVQLALQVLEQLNMITTNQGFFAIAGWEEYQSVDKMEKLRAQTRKRVEKHREKQRLLQSNVTGNVTVTQSNATDIDKDIDIDKRKDIPKGISKRKCFAPPTVDEVRAYCQERGNNIDPQRFVDFYESKGWFVGKNKMKDWKAAVRNWEGRDKQTIPKQPNEKTWGAKIYDLRNEQNYPFFGFPEEWFDGHDLNESRVTSVIHPIDKQRGIYEEFTIKPQELIDLYRLRRDYYEQRK